MILLDNGIFGIFCSCERRVAQVGRPGSARPGTTPSFQIRVTVQLPLVETAQRLALGQRHAALADRALAVARRIECGICHINGATVYDEAQLPFGGTKASGYGRFGGKAGIAEFTDLRWITIETQPGHFPI